MTNDMRSRLEDAYVESELENFDNLDPEASMRAVIIKGGSAIAVYATSGSEMPKLFLVDDEMLTTFALDETTPSEEHMRLILIGLLGHVQLLDRDRESSRPTQAPGLVPRSLDSQVAIECQEPTPARIKQKFPRAPMNLRRKGR